MTYFVAGQINGQILTINQIKTWLQTEGWTVVDLNSTAISPPASRIGREILAFAPGLAAGVGDPAIHAIGFAHIASTVNKIYCYAAAAIRGPINILTVTYSGSTATITTDGNHSFVTGERVFFNGCDIPEYNIAPSRVGAPTVEYNGCTVTGPDTLTVPTELAPAALGTANGGQIFGVHNMVGSRTSANNVAAQMAPAEDFMDVYAQIDKFHCTLALRQTSLISASFSGKSQRFHVGDDERGAALITNGPIVSDGATPVTINLDRDISGGMFVDGWAQIHNPDNSEPESIHPSRSDSTAFQITDIFSGTSIEAVLPAGTWVNGAIIGNDAQAVHCGATNSNQVIEACAVYASHNVAGVAAVGPHGTVFGPELFGTTNEETGNDPSGSRVYHANPIALYHADGSREYLPGCAAITRGAQNDGQIQRGGSPANSPAKDFVVFTQNTIQGWNFGIGPGAFAP